MIYVYFGDFKNLQITSGRNDFHYYKSQLAKTCAMCCKHMKQEENKQNIR